MNTSEIEKQLAALFAAIEKLQNEEAAKKSSPTIAGLGISFDELQKSDNASKALVELHNKMWNEIHELRERVLELEENS